MTREASAPEQALDDLLVIEIGDEATQYCGQLLAELGARVIKVEPPGGAGARHRGPWKDDRPDPNGSLYFWAFNTSKEGMTLDLEVEADRRLLKQLARQADVLLEDGPPGRLDALGLGYARLSELNPGLILTSITPFGQTGPRAHWKGSDLVFWAAGGILAGAGYGEPGAPPLQSHGDLAYLVGGHAGFVGTLVALTGRDLTGEGQHVDASIHEACSYINRGAVTLQGRAETAQFNGDALLPPAPQSYGLKLPTVLCKGGKHLLAMTNMVGPPSWTKFAAWCRELGVGQARWPLWVDELAAMGGGRSLSGAVLSGYAETLAEIAGDHTADELAAIGQAMGFTWAAFNAPDELMDDAQLQARGFFQEVAHPEHGRSYVYAGEPYGFSEAGWRLKSRAPLLGEHDHELRAWLGRSANRR